MQTSIGSGDIEVAVSSGDLFQGPAVPSIPSHCKSARFPVFFFKRGYPWISMCYVMIPVLEK